MDPYKMDLTNSNRVSDFDWRTAPIAGTHHLVEPLP